LTLQQTNFMLVLHRSVESAPLVSPIRPGNRAEGAADR
jgi:hypothetical protein